MNPNPPSHEAIAACAYLLWEKAGRPPGRDKEFWQRAEQQLQSDSRPPTVPPVQPPPLPSAPDQTLPPAIREVVKPATRPPAPRKRRAR